MPTSSDSRKVPVKPLSANITAASTTELKSTLNKIGVKPVGYVGEGCIGCGICFYNCPEPYALRVVKGER